MADHTHHSISFQRGSWLWGIIALATLSVIQILSVVRSAEFFQPPKPIGDGPDYENIAWNLSVGNGFSFDWTDPRWKSPYQENGADRYAAQLSRTSSHSPTTGRPPLLPWMIAAVYQIVPRDPVAFGLIRVINAMAIASSGALAVIGSYWILRRWNFHRLAVAFGCMATLGLASVDRTIREYALDFLTEPLAYLLTQSFVMLAWLAADRFHRQRFSDANDPAGHVPSYPNAGSWMIGLAVLIALMVYCRSIFIFYLPGVALLLWILCRGRNESSDSNRPSSPRIGKFVLATMMISIAFLLPWWVRNCLVLKAWMPLGTQGPISLLGGYCDESFQAGGEWQVIAETRLRERLRSSPDYLQMDPIAQEVMVAKEAQREVLAWAQQHRSDLPRLAMMRVTNLWSPYSGRSLILKGLLILGTIALLLSRRREVILLIGLPLITTVVVAVLYSTGGRFLVPCYGLFYSLGGIGIAWCVHAMMCILLGSPTKTNRAHEVC